MTTESGARAGAPGGRERRGHPWFSVPLPRADARLRLFCLPFAGGGASTYLPWARALAARPIEVLAAQPPGRENRLAEAPFTAMSPLVEALATAIEPFLDRPYALMGHSMGATIAFELAHELRARGRPLPRHLFAAGALAPDAADPDEPLHTIADDDAFVAAVARRFGGVPQEVLDHEELRRLVAIALRADLRLHESHRYVARAPLPLDLTAYGGSDDDKVDAAALEGWRSHVTGAFASRVFPGNHFFLQTARDDLLRDLLARLDLPAA